MISDDKILKIKSKIIVNEFNKLIDKNPIVLQPIDLFQQSSIFGLIDKQTLPLEEYYNKFNLKLNNTIINDFTSFYNNFYIKKYYFEISDLLTNYFNENIKLTPLDLLYIVFLSYIYTYNKKTIDCNILLQKTKVLNTKEISTPGFQHIRQSFNSQTSAKMIYSMVSNLLNANLIVSLDDGFNRLKVYNKSFFRTVTRIVNSHIKFVTELNNLQLHRNKLFKQGVTDEARLTRLALQAYPSVVYNNHNGILTNYESKLYPLLNGYFTYPKYKNLMVETSILDAYWYDASQTNQLIFELNSLDNQAFYAILKYATLFINNKNLEAYQETINNFHRVLMPDFGKLDQDKVNIITGLSTLDVEKHPPAHLLLCRAALDKLKITNNQEIMLEDIIMKKNESKTKNEKAKKAELWGEFTEYCGRIKCVADTENFIKWIDGKLELPENKEELEDWETFKSIVGD